MSPQKNRSLHKLDIYKRPQNYAGSKDTLYVESFNNALLQFHDKRIVFGERAYKMRTNLALIDWNWNVNRDHPSVKFVADDKAPRRQVGKPILVKKSYDYRDIILDRWMNASMHPQSLDCPMPSESGGPIPGEENFKKIE
jgi:hypothetical protein